MATKWTNANYAFRAVLLAPGKHIVRFRYQPKSFRWGAAISLAMLGLWLPDSTLRTSRRKCPLRLISHRPLSILHLRQLA
jgi:hypothetical protein